MNPTLQATHPSTTSTKPSVKSLLINELYSSIQGESSYAGQPCTFVRLTGCPLRCVWCDSAFAFQGGRRFELEAIVREVTRLGLPLVEVTGGEPLAQPGCLDLLNMLADAGFVVLLETSGAFDIAPVDPRVIRVMDIKCPDSGESARNRWANLDHLRPHDELKFVIASRRDYDWARRVMGEHSLASRCVVHFSPVHSQLESKELAGWILEDRLPVRLQVQLHKIIWPGQTQGI